MIESNMKNFFNKTRPKFGLKNYSVADTTLKDAMFKIKSIAINKKDGKDSFTDIYTKN
jgi:hypothetical protein